MDRIEKAWQDYVSSVSHYPLPPFMMAMMKVTFFAGATAFYHEVMTTLSPGTEATESDLQVIAELDAELRRFAEASLGSLNH